MNVTGSTTPENTPTRNTARQKGHLFISYSRSDRLGVDRLYDDLSRRHYDLWMDVNERGIEAGENWRQELERQLSASEAVIACLSPDFLESAYCRAEIEQAHRERKMIYPVIVRRLHTTDNLEAFNLGHLQYIDLTYGEQAYELGMKRLRSVLPRPRLRYFAGDLLKAAVRVLAIIGVFALGMVAMWRLILAFLPPPNISDTDVGVAVAQFSVPDDGSVSATDARSLSQRFSNLLEQELKAAIPPLGLTLGYLGPGVIGPVKGDPDTVRNQFGAKIIVYGEIIKNARGQLELTPRFYVDPRAFPNVPEITGGSKLGSTIRIASLADPIPIQQTLSTRSTALAYVVIGLSQYTSRDYTGAIESFMAALDQPELDVEQGGQAVRVLLGSTYLKLASIAAQRGDLDTAGTQLEQATAEYQTVREQAPDYARAYVGLAAATYLKWNITSQQTGTAAPPDLLEQGLDYLDQAERSEDQPQFIFQIRAQYARMQIEYHLWADYPPDALPEGRHDELLTDFRRRANRIIESYDGGRNPALQDIAAWAYAYRGLAFYGLSDCASAIDEFDAALNISEENEQTMFIAGWLGGCYQATGQTDKSITAFTQAHEIAQATEGVSQTLIDSYQQKLDELQSRG